MSILTTDLLRRWQEEYAKRKEPIDSDIEKRRKTASNPPKDAMPGLNPNGDTGRTEKVDSMDDRAAKPNLEQAQWFLGSYTLTPILDEHTGLAKWPLSFKRIEKDTKRPNKGVLSPDATKPGDAKPEQPPTAV